MEHTLTPYSPDRPRISDPLRILLAHGQVPRDRFGRQHLPPVEPRLGDSCGNARGPLGLVALRRVGRTRTTSRDGQYGQHGAVVGSQDGQADGRTDEGSHQVDHEPRMGADSPVSDSLWTSLRLCKVVLTQVEGRAQERFFASSRFVVQGRNGPDLEFEAAQARVCARQSYRVCECRSVGRRRRHLYRLE